MIVIELKALQISAQMNRWSCPTDYPTTRTLYGLPSPLFIELGVTDHQEQKRILGACIGRPVHSFKEVLGGEIKALKEEPRLKDIIRYVWQSEE